jgi:hypothetical protein
MLLAVRRDKRREAAAELKAQKESELGSQEPEKQEEQKEEEIATENPNNQSHNLALLPNTDTPCLKRVKTPISYKQKWNWEFDGIVTEKSIDSKHQSINITNPKTPKTPKSRWSNLKSKAKSIIRKYVPLMSRTKDKQ